MANEKEELAHPRLTLAELGEKGKSPEAAKFTPEAEERRRNRAKKPFYTRSIYFNAQATKDGIRHFVEGMGDTNPLFLDAEYAKKTKYESIIAPGTYLYTVQWGAVGVGWPGIHGWYVGGDWEWYRPILAGDEFKVICILREFVEKKGKMGSGRTWVDYDDVIYINQDGEIAGKEHCHYVLAERGASGSAGKYRAIPKPEYTKEDWHDTSLPGLRSRHGQ